MRQRALNEIWGRTRGLARSGSGSECRPVRLPPRCSAPTERVEYTLVGDTVNLAQRLQDLARPAGRIVMNESTFTSLRDPVECVKLDEIMVKGRQTPVHAFRIDVYSASDVEVEEEGTTMSDQPVVETHGLRKTFESEGAPVRAARRRLHDDAGRVRRGDGPVGLREVDAAQHRRRPRHPDRRRGVARG